MLIRTTYTSETDQVTLSIPDSPALWIHRIHRAERMHRDHQLPYQVYKVTGSQLFAGWAEPAVLCTQREIAHLICAEVHPDKVEFEITFDGEDPLGFRLSRITLLAVVGEDPDTLELSA